MKCFNYFIVALFVVFSFSLIANAGGLSYYDKQKLREAGVGESEIRKIERNMEYKYEGASGTRYKYDLSDPSDRLEYELDLGAKIEDELHMPITPGVELDRGLDQFGGGVEW